MRGAGQSVEAGAEVRQAVPARQEMRAVRGEGAVRARGRCPGGSSPPRQGRGRAPAGSQPAPPRPPGRWGLSALGCPGRNRLPRALRGSCRSERELRKVAVTVGEESSRQVSNKADSGRRIPQQQRNPRPRLCLGPAWNWAPSPPVRGCGAGEPRLSCRCLRAAPELRGCLLVASDRPCTPCRAGFSAVHGAPPRELSLGV